MTKKGILSFLFLLLSLNLLSPFGVSYASELNQDTKDFCSALFSSENTKLPHNYFQYAISIMKLRWNKKWAIPNVVILNSTPKTISQFVRSEDDEGREQGNYILSLGNSFPQFDQGQMEHYRILERKILRESRKLRSLLFTRTAQACEEKAIRYHLDVTDLLKLQKEKNEMKEISSFLEGESLRLYFDKVRSHLKHHWVFWEGVSLMDIYQILKHPKTRNVILVLHGEKSGHLFDAHEVPLPISFFNQMAPSLQSLGVYACYSEESNRIYKIAERIKNTESLNGERFFFYLPVSNILGIQGIAPAFGFGEFLMSVDLFLSQKKSEIPQLGQHMEDESCSMKSDDFDVVQGEIGFFVNNEFVGSMNVERQQHKELNQKFPCTFLKNGLNQISIENLTISRDSDVRNHDFHLSLVLPGFELTQDFPIKHSLRDNGLYRSSKKIFVVKKQ